MKTTAKFMVIASVFCVISNTNALEPDQVYDLQGSANPADPNPVYSNSFSPDKSTVATSDRYGYIKIWDIANMKCMATLRRGKTAIFTIKHCPDGRSLIAGDNYGVIDIWDLRTNTLRLSWTGHRCSIQGLDISQDGRYLATASWDQSVKLWDVKTGKELLQFQHEGSVDCVKFIPHQQRLVTSTVNQPLRIWNTVNGKMGKLLEGTGDATTTIVVSSDGLMIILGDGYGEIRKWDLAKGVTANRYNHHSKLISSLCLSTDGRLLISASHDGYVVVRRLVDNTILMRHKGQEKIASVGIGCNDQVIITAGFEGIVKLWKLKD